MPNLTREDFDHIPPTGPEIVCEECGRIDGHDPECSQACEWCGKEHDVAECPDRGHPAFRAYFADAPSLCAFCQTISHSTSQCRSADAREAFDTRGQDR